jgi:streptogramin lyase
MRIQHAQGRGVVQGAHLGEATAATLPIVEFPAFGDPDAIVTGPDDNLWFTDRRANRLGRMSRAGLATMRLAIPTANSGPVDITLGPDKAYLWFTESSANRIGRFTPLPSPYARPYIITEFPVPTANSGPSGIAPGPDGNVWFTEMLANEIGRITGYRC